MLNLLKQELDKANLFNRPVHPLIEALADAIPNENIPKRMKYTIAVSEAVLFASQFRKNIHHWNDSLIPVNAISFCLSASGSGKDSSVSAVRKCFSFGYEMIESKRIARAKEKAIQQAANDEINEPHKFQNYKPYLLEPNPIFTAPSTLEGLIQHFNDLSSDGIAAGYLFTGEFGSELSTNPLLLDNIRLLAEMYDEGNKEVKVLKNRENQSKEIKNFPVSALLMGSQGNILYDESIKRRFRTEFSTKLARRSFFNFNKVNPPRKPYDSVKSMLLAEIALEEEAVKTRNEIQVFIKDITKDLLKSIGEPLKVSTEVRDHFLLYKKYNELKSEQLSRQYEISKLVRLHLQWKALKLAGALTILNGNTTIELEDYADAVSFCELLDEDMVAFEQELVKEPYEVFVDYMKSILDEDNKAHITLHSLRKMGYIPMSGNPTQKIKDLIHLASSYDSTGIYKEFDNGISYEPIEITDTIGVSYLPVTGTKDQRRTQCAEGYTYLETTFAELGDLLAEDFAYSPFNFKHGRRGKEFIQGGCKWVCLDVDESAITDEEAHLLLSDINHHIARTSDPNNEFKFRVMIELDSVVNIPDLQWKTFLESISKELGIVCDLLPKAQIYFSYANRNVLSVTDASPLEAKPHIMAALEKQPQTTKKLTKAQMTTQLADPIETFSYAFLASQGGRSRALIRAAYHARDLGADKQYILDLMEEINDYLDYPLDQDRLQRTILNQIERWPI